MAPLTSAVIVLLSANIVLLCAILIVIWRITRYFYPPKKPGHPMRQGPGTACPPVPRSKPPYRRYNARKY